MGGYDQLSIISLNSAKKGLCSMSADRSARYLDYVLNGMSPDICFLPGDDKAVKFCGTVTGYEHYVTQRDTVLLYNSTKVRMNKPDINFFTFGYLRGLNFDNLVCPKVEITGPHKNVVKQFNLVTWHHTMYQEAGVDAETLTESLVRFSTMFAETTGQGVLISGEMPVPFNKVEAIVNTVCKKRQKEFMQVAHSNLEEYCFLPSMSKSVTRDRRHLFMMKVFQCQRQKSNGIVQEYQQPEADCFIASKSLQLTETSLVNLEDVFGRQVNVRPCDVADKTKAPTKTPTGNTTRPSYHCPVPTQTSMTIAPRPPRHSGG